MLYDWVPNLDCMTIDPKDMQRLSVVLAKLAQYANEKGCAMDHRLNGEINLALAHEHNCEVIYNDLPKDARW